MKHEFNIMDINIKFHDLIFIDASGFSMWPFLKPGQKLVIKKVSIGDLRVGDIILYRANNQLICHRLVKKINITAGGLLYVRGDNSTSAPEPVAENMFLGKAIGIVKDGKLIKLTIWKQQFINRLIIGIAPWVAAVKPYYIIFRKIVRGYK